MNNMLARFTINDAFIGRIQNLVHEVVIPYQEKALKDEIEGIEKSHAIDNFRLAAEVVQALKRNEKASLSQSFYGMVFQDSDLAKWLEAAAYDLKIHPNPELEKRCDEIIELMGQAQHEDGYLNTYFTVKEPEKRWTNLRDWHELYCAGHLMEAAVAYAECTGKTRLVEVMSSMADHIYNRFIVEKTEGFSGHPEIELALMRLYRYTRNERYFELAKHFVDVRGVDSDYFIKENEQRTGRPWQHPIHDKEYSQHMKPVREQTEAVGHAVRAVYLYTGMADIAIETKDDELEQACKALWQNITGRRMYLTGAIGSAYEGESFTKDYHLPNDTAYAETCASIGLIFFARKMLKLDKSSCYADVMERALYNCVLAGMQLDGKRFFYVNPLEVVPGVSGQAITHRHALPQRPAWYACACCPPNVARLLASIASYAWSLEQDTLYSHLFVGGTLDVCDTLQGKIEVETRYPYDHQVVYRFMPDQEAMNMTLAIRLPEWSQETKILLNGELADIAVKNGYAYLPRAFTGADQVTVLFDMSIRRIYASEKIAANSGRVAFSRGPLVYCAEGTDNQQDILSLYVDKNGSAQAYESDKLGGMIGIKVDGFRKKAPGDGLYQYDRPDVLPDKIKLVPYYTWGNRELNQMRVWLPEI